MEAFPIDKDDSKDALSIQHSLQYISQKNT